MYGLEVKKLTSDYRSFPGTLGKFEISYTTITGGTVPAGLLFNWKDLESVTLKGAGISSFSKDVFKYNTQLKVIDISDNTFTSLPSGLFDGLNSLAELRVQNINWDCTCDNLWIVQYIEENKIAMIGNNFCSGSYTSLKNYYYSNCVEVIECDSSEMKLSGKCTKIGVFVMYIFFIIALCVIVTSLAMTIHTMRIMPDVIASQTKEVNSKAKDKWNLMADSVKNTSPSRSAWDNVLKNVQK